MLNLNGNTAVYMLYAHARIASIVRKVGKDWQELAKTSKISLEHPAEVGIPTSLRAQIFAASLTAALSCRMQPGSPGQAESQGPELLIDAGCILLVSNPPVCVRRGADAS